MPLTEKEKGRLQTLIDQERQRHAVEGPPDPFWLVDVIASDEIRAEALRLVTAAKDAKQAEINDWPTKAQAEYAQLQDELAELTTLESKLTP